jgi:hypothetical protein
VTKFVKTCGAAQYQGDGFCDDANNNGGCSWDGGDCCGSTGKPNQMKFCKSCKCLDCTNVCPADKTGKARKTCGSSTYLGDGFCDDNLNIAACKFDGGDCCPSADKSADWKDYCQECKCKTT